MTSGRPWLPVGRLSLAPSCYCHLCRGGHGQWGWRRGGVATAGTENLLLSRLSPGRHSTAAAGSGQPLQGHETSTNPRHEGPCRPPGATPAPTIEVRTPPQRERAAELSSK